MSTLVRYLECMSGQAATRCPQSSGCFQKSLPFIQVFTKYIYIYIEKHILFLLILTAYSKHIVTNQDESRINRLSICAAGKMLCYCRLVYMPMSYLYGKRFVGRITGLVQSLREELYIEPYREINWNKARNSCAKVSHTKLCLSIRPCFTLLLKHNCLLLQEDLYYPHPLAQDMLWGFLHHVAEPILTRWPFSIMREKALKVALKHIHYEDENSRYYCIGCVEKVTCIGAIA